MEKKKRIMKALLALVMAAALVGLGYGIAPALKSNNEFPHLRL